MKYPIFGYYRLSNTWWWHRQAKYLDIWLPNVPLSLVSKFEPFGTQIQTSRCKLGWSSRGASQMSQTNYWNSTKSTRIRDHISLTLKAMPRSGSENHYGYKLNEYYMHNWLVVLPLTRDNETNWYMCWNNIFFYVFSLICWNVHLLIIIRPMWWTSQKQLVEAN